MMFSREIDSIDSDEKDSRFLVELGWKLLRNVSLGTGSKWANHTRAGQNNVALLIYLGDRLNMVCASRLEEKKRCR